MDIKNLKHLVIIFFILLAGLSGAYYKYSCDKNAYRLYNQGVALYNQNKYQDAYYNFRQIKRFSKIYELALLKQYQSAIKIGDKKTAIFILKNIIKTTRNDYIRPWALYSEAILTQELKLNTDIQSCKKFKYIQEKFPESDFAVASAFKVAQLSKTLTPNVSKQNYIKYLSYAPNGKFSLKSIEELEKLNNLSTDEEFEIFADAKLASEQYKGALEYYNKTSFLKNWHKILKCYKGIGDKNLEKQTILRALALKTPTDEKEINNAIDRFVNITEGSKMQILQDLYTKYQGAYSFPTITYKLAENSGEVRAIKLYEMIANDYPESIWASNALWEVFWYNYQEARYKTCEKYARVHISRYSNTQDSPRIAYWYGKALLKNRKNQQAREVFYDIIHEFPLSYYAFLSARQLKMSKAKKMIVKKTILDYDRKNLNKFIFEDKTLLELANLNDWELIDEFKIDDEYIKSWVAYQKKNYPIAINIAKDKIIKSDKEKSKNNEYISFSDQMLKMMYPIFYADEINELAKNTKQSPYLFLSLIREESHFNSNAKSTVGAMGLTQLMQGTANFIEKSIVSKETLYDEYENIRIGLKYFSYLMNQFDNNEYLAILSYNAGPGNVKKWLNDSNIKSDEIDIFVENIPYLETKNYIKKIISSYWVYLNIYSPKNK